ncbi:MAG: chaperone protein HscA [Pseudomonadota bacterium]
MALLQIAEPGQSTAPHQRRFAVGIDLGTTHSLVAAVRSGVPEVLPDLLGRRLLPSVVRYAEGQAPEVGQDALSGASEDPLNTIASVKRLMGRGLQDAQRLRVPYQLEAHGQDGVVRIITRGGVKTPVEVSADILRVLRDRAESALGDSLVGAVITVPAYFDDAQRQATKDAAALAGLHVLRLLNEPTAAALAYGLESGREGLYAVYDLGGGTFDLSLLRLRQGVFEVVATGGDAELGGDDLDEAIAEFWLQGWGLQREGLGAGEWRRLLALARRLKEQLSDAGQQGRVSDIWVREDGMRPLALLDADGLASLAKPLLDRSFSVCDQAIHDARIQRSDIQGVVLVGGSTRLLALRQAVEDYFGKPPLCDLHPDEVVALGAALQASLLAGHRADGDDWLLLDVLPLSLGLETMGGLAEKVIPRNTPIPVARAQSFTTYQDGQTAMAIHVVQGERELVAECRSLARFELRGIPPMVAGAARIEVTFQVDADGLLSVTAEEQSTGVKASVQVKPSYGLSDEQVAQMLQDAFSHAKEDVQHRAIREQQVELEQLLMGLGAALAQDGDLLTPEERSVLDQVMAEARSVCGGHDLEALRSALSRVSAASEPFAAKRMDRAVAMALRGQSIDQL